MPSLKRFYEQQSVTDWSCCRSILNRIRRRICDIPSYCYTNANDAAADAANDERSKFQAADDERVEAKPTDDAGLGGTYDE